MNQLVGQQAAICKKIDSLIGITVFSLTILISSFCANASSILFDIPIEPKQINYVYEIKEWKKTLDINISLDEKQKITSLKIYLDKKQLITEKMFNIIKEGSPYYGKVLLSTKPSNDLIKTEKIFLDIELNSGDGLRDISNRKNDISRALSFVIDVNGDLEILYFEFKGEEVLREKLY